MNYYHMSFFVGGYDKLFCTLLLFIIIDYITGILRAIYSKNLNSKIGAKGIIKKIGYILIVITTSTIDQLINGNGNIRNIVIYMFLTNEGLSIIENWNSMGIKTPQILKEKIKLLKDKNKEE